MGIWGIWETAARPAAGAGGIFGEAISAFFWRADFQIRTAKTCPLSSIPGEHEASRESAPKARKPFRDWGILGQSSV
jgi:hypothetical protein